MESLRGRVWKYGDDLDTDAICPPTILLSTSSLEELARHAMETIDPDFVNKVRPGDIMVAGKNTGCGSSREQAPMALKAAGISAIIADSFARIFFRNCITIGLPVLQCEGIHARVNEGDLLDVDLETGRITNVGSGEVFQGEPLQDLALQIIEDGGLIPHFKRDRTS